MDAVYKSWSLPLFESIMILETAHEIWTKLEDTYCGFDLDEVNLLFVESIEDFSRSPSYQDEHPIASTFECLDITWSSMSPTGGKSQCNDILNGDSYCDINIFLTSNDIICMVRKAKLVIDELEKM